MNIKIFGWGGFVETVYNRDGDDREGYDLFGYNRDGYDRQGFNREGYDREGYNWKKLLTDNIYYKSKN